MDASPSPPDSEHPLWAVVPLSDYAVPSSPDQHVVRKKWAAFRSLLRPQEEAQTPVRAEADLRALAGVRLENLVPPIDWAQAVAALDQVLAGDAERPLPGSSVRFLIGQPHCAHVEVLTHWANAHGARVLAPPRPEAVISGDEQWLAELSGPEGPWVLPALERCFLRHAAGLSLGRQILDRAASGRLGTGLIGCDSWAWAYLQRVFPVPQLPALTLQAFDGRRLTELFLRLSLSNGAGAVRFRNARTGASVLPDPEALESGSFDVSRELRQLAAHCRGNPGIAWRYWRQRLRAEPESEEAERSSEQEQSPAEWVVWLADLMEEQVPPAEQADDAVLILHALLLHNGLPEWLLPELLPLPPAQIASLLWRMEALGIVELADERWRVAALGYATARRMLRERTYLVDAF